MTNVNFHTYCYSVLKDEKSYYERHGLGELDRIHFVGRKKYIKKIQKDLASDDIHGQREHLYVCHSLSWKLLWIFKTDYHFAGILICGMYGMGKTTLAKKICKEAMREMELKYVDLR